ncbi:MAG: trypsin-like serine protease [Sphingopyxis sp.]|nr:trypsin-like serine protease [Sphingopyxis sp.]
MSGAAHAVVCGTPVRATEFPWLVGIALVSKPGHLAEPSCSGTLIAADIVMTALHCIDRDPSMASVQIVRHVNKDRLTVADQEVVGEVDVVLLRLASAIDEPALTFPTFPKNRAMRDVDYSIAGWGYSLSPKVIPDKLSCPQSRANAWPHHAAVRLVDPALCVRFTAQKDAAEPHVLCAHGGAEGSPPERRDDVLIFDRAGPGACIADSGGPLFNLANGGAVIITGVTLDVVNVKDGVRDTWLSCARNPARFADTRSIRPDVDEALRRLRARAPANTPNFL